MFFVLILLIASIAYLLIYFSNKKKDKLKTINALNKQNVQIVKEIRSIEQKMKTSKIYIDMWENKLTDEQKKLSGINVAIIEQRIKDLGGQNFLSNIGVSYSPTIMINNKDFSRDNIRTYTSLFTIKFLSITDVNIYTFINSLKNDLGYFIVIEELNIKRTGKVDNDFLKSLKNGNLLSAVSGEIKLRIYGLGVQDF